MHVVYLHVACARVPCIVPCDALCLRAGHSLPPCAAFSVVSRSSCTLLFYGMFCGFFGHAMRCLACAVSHDTCSLYVLQAAAVSPGTQSERQEDEPHENHCDCVSHRYLSVIRTRVARASHAKPLCCCCAASRILWITFAWVTVFSAHGVFLRIMFTLWTSILVVRATSSLCNPRTPQTPLCFAC